MAFKKIFKEKTVFEILIIIILFIFFSYFIQNNIELIKHYIKNDFFGMIVYVLITIIAIVIAPVSTFPLIPLASNLWGWFIAGILSILGWEIGAIIAFIIARKYGIKLIKRFVFLEKINKFEKMIPKKNLFLSVIFLRMSIPVDILSYALGLFSKMKTGDYIIATFIGIIPFAFIFAYLGEINIYYQILAFLIAGIIILIGILIRKNQ